MVRILGMEINPKTWGKSWALAMVNTGRGFAEMFSVPRLWIGIGVSIAVHALFFLFTSGVFTPKATEGEGEYDMMNVVVDESLPPKAQKILQKQASNPFSVSATESEVIDLETRQAPSQAQIRSDEEFDLSGVQSGATGDEIRINKDAAMSTSDLLNEATISLKRSSHAYGGTRFEAIAASGGGPAFDLKSASDKIGEAEVIKTADQGSSAREVAADVGTGGGSGTTFQLEGIDPADILRKQLPQYPSWAKEKGFSRVTISISFTVDASGNVQPTMLVRTSSGYTKWDNEVKRALRGWKFKEASGPA
ncbi:TonB family protein, partial [candidate division WOR-3 bacterium]|nr:TonB family protein [candidate division WOR-3 bacterium]MBD3363835.1 TonB family protein [candidate division WOR-3 bacterium]